MIAAKWGDPVAGIDVHIVMVPPPAGPGAGTRHRFPIRS